MKTTAALVSLASLALVHADCISDCESTAASSLGCDASDISGCYCLDDFATAAKACLYQNSDCGKTYVAEFYTEHDSACSGVSATGTAAAAETSAATSSSSDCVASCESTAADSLGCDASDSSCFCQDDFATAAKACLYENGCDSSVSTFYEAYNSQCASSGSDTTASAAGSTTPAAAATETSAASQPATTSVAIGGSVQSSTQATWAEASTAVGGVSSATVASSVVSTSFSTPTLSSVVAGASGSASNSSSDAEASTVIVSGAKKMGLSFGAIFAAFLAAM